MSCFRSVVGVLVLGFWGCQGGGEGEPNDGVDARGAGGPDGGGPCSESECAPDAAPPVVPTAFRVERMRLLDPHLYAGFFCIDITSEVNSTVAEKIAGDEDGDGQLDLSVMAVFRPLDQRARAPVEVSQAACTAPVASTSCMADPATRVSTMAEPRDSGTCLEAVSGTTGPGISVAAVSTPCFVTDAETISLELAGIPIMLDDARVSATYAGDPATRLRDGLALGFLSEAQANSIVLPETLTLVGGDPLSSILPGGQGSCASGDGGELDVGPDGTTTGWYMYLDFEAVPVALSE